MLNTHNNSSSHSVMNNSFFSKVTPSNDFGAQYFTTVIKDRYYKINPNQDHLNDQSAFENNLFPIFTTYINAVAKDTVKCFDNCLNQRICIYSCEFKDSTQALLTLIKDKPNLSFLLASLNSQRKTQSSLDLNVINNYLRMSYNDFKIESHLDVDGNVLEGHPLSRYLEVLAG